MIIFGLKNINGNIFIIFLQYIPTSFFMGIGNLIIQRECWVRFTGIFNIYFINCEESAGVARHLGWKICINQRETRELFMYKPVGLPH